MFMDEARFGRISDTRRCWCPKPFRPVCSAMVSQEYTYAYAAVSVSDGIMDSLILPHVNGDCMQIFLDEVSARHRNDRIIMVLDGAGWHRNESLEVPANISLLSLPPYSPELNPVERLWHWLREHHWSNRTYADEQALVDEAIRSHRTLRRKDIQSICRTRWITPED